MTHEQQMAVDFRNSERDEFDSEFSTGDTVRFCLECEEPTTNDVAITDTQSGKSGVLCRICAAWSK